jgi:exosortase
MATNVSSEIGEYAPGWTAARNRWFLVLWILSLIAFRVPLAALLALALHDERYEHILLVPVISALLIWLRRERILSESRYSPGFGIPLLLAGTALAVAAGRLEAPSQYNRLFVMTLAIVLVWIAVAVLCYGTQAIGRAIFPWLFLLLILPIPANIMDAAVVALQKGSAEITAGLFKLIGMPFVRQGFTFSLPGVQIYIAEECSGIRSSLSLLISGILASHLFLRSVWSQACFTLLIVPVVIFKNAVRIATISWLGVHVDRGFFFGNLHRHGGLPFSLLAIAMLVPVLVLLRTLEKRHEGQATK